MPRKCANGNPLSFPSRVQTNYQSRKIPGLEKHDASLYLKLDDPKRQKDLRPVASLASVPKRMLKIVFDHAKAQKKTIFYGPNDYSGPKRGAIKLAIVTYEHLMQGHFGVKPSKRKFFKTKLKLWDRSNAFNTFGRKESIGFLEIEGPFRDLICNAIISQIIFSVRTKDIKSTEYPLVTRGPQGQCGTAEIYSSLNKQMTLPIEFPNATHPIHARRHNYVDDTSDTQTTHIDDEAEVDKISNEKMKSDNKRLLLCLNDEKFEEMECFVKELTQKSWSASS